MYTTGDTSYHAWVDLCTKIAHHGLAQRVAAEVRAAQLDLNSNTGRTVPVRETEREGQRERGREERERERERER